MTPPSQQKTDTVGPHNKNNYKLIIQLPLRKKYSPSLVVVVVGELDTAPGGKTKLTTGSNRDLREKQGPGTDGIFICLWWKPFLFMMTKVLSSWAFYLSHKSRSNNHI
ncbi:hypothetical protein AVEN_223487-1 [Araneus ventricosus]|uniref:Uncharacterized protein n=1 Tax=Araneus ventricosus TaxID=182803 RepID=A0A4Y2N4W2_ARAVE|nr:hypothetical protein AVEN_223487-1 [Araneus ventricosus]